MLNVTKLKAVRLSRALSQSEVARRVGISSGHYSNIEKGKRSASLETMDAIYQVLGISPEDVRDDNGATPIADVVRPEKGIVIENGEGMNKTRIILPPTPETYALIADRVMQWDRNMLDPKLREFFDDWKGLDETRKDQLLKIVKGLNQDNS